MFGMSLDGKVIAGLGAGSLAIAGLLQWAKFDSDNSPGFLARAFDSEFDWLSIVFAILGLLVLLCAFFVNRRDRQLREFEEALKRSNQP
ncbi:MAG: hypothetical protein ABSD67_10925 [Terracidiphilus sp.]|jgi:hypothetical protein